MRVIRANSFRQANRTAQTIKWVVIHTAEITLSPTSAESVARFFADEDTDVSAHVCTDSNSAVRCVQDKDVAFHALNFNERSLGVEMCTRARTSAEAWKRPAHMKLLEKTAVVVADWCKDNRIPPVWLTAAELRAAKPGIVSHKVASDVHGEGQRSDPGEGFPEKLFVKRVKAHMARKRRFRWVLFDGEGRELAQSAVFERGDREFDRLLAFERNRRGPLMRELDQDRDIVLRKRRV